MASLRYPTRLAARTAAPVSPVSPVAPVVAPTAPVASAPARKRYLTRLAFVRLRGRMDGHAQRAWDADGPRVLYIIRAVTRRLAALMADLRRAYRTKPYSWIAETFDPRLKVFRDQAQWIGDQLRPHSTAVVCELEYHELLVALQSCVVLIKKVCSKS